MDLFADLNAALGALVLERQPDRRFLRRGPLPAWCQKLPVAGADPFPLEELFPFLEVFLPEAERAWQGKEARVDSQFWTETAADGEELHLEACALRVGPAPLLVIARNDRLFLQQQLVLQRARELYLTYATLRRETQDKDVLVHCIVHDLAAPLNSILGTLSLLRERPLPEPETRWIRLAFDTALRQRELIREILYIFSSEQGALAAPPDPAEAPEIAAAIREVASELEPVARGRRVSLALPAAAPQRVLAERARLIRVLTNLLENAIRHSPAGGLVRLTLADEGDSLLLGVEDQGPGVPPELAPRLFQKFVKGQGRLSGTGLGLYFCRITLERWGGQIGYQDRPGGGARFWLRLRKPPQGDP
jgi:signal transduction histidine kinase